MPPMVTVNRLPLQQGIQRPSALERLGPVGGSGDFHGMIENAEPVSTR
jgi:hypothetical protein